MGGLIYYYRKNVGGQWEICQLNKEEALGIQAKILKYSLLKIKEIKEVAQKNSIAVSEETLAVMLNKIVPSYESLANDYIEEKIKERTK